MKKILMMTLLSVASLFAFEELNMDNFDSKLKGKNVIVDFYASWCPPCKIIATELDNFEVSKPENVTIYKVNVDDQMALAEKYGVSQLPTLMFFKDGKVVEKSIGVLTADELGKYTKEIFKK